MKRITARLLLFLASFSYILNSFPTTLILADELANVQIRLDRHKISTTTGGQVCVTTPSSNNGTENNFQVVFPTGFTVNSTASNWTTTVADIPNDATAWPGIGTATAVNGQIVTFPSSDLSINTKYCFNFTSTNTLTNPSTAESYEGLLRTRSTTTIIDSKAFAFSITSNDQITVTASVGASPTDFDAELTLASHVNGTFRQDTRLTYILTYGSHLDTASNITPEIEWDLGTIAGSSTPTVEILSYEVGSATEAYGGTAPVVDLVNRKISWPITSFPANTTGQTVTFMLRTTSTFQNPVNVHFEVHGRTHGPGTQTADSTLESTYRYNFSPENPQLPGDGRSDGRSDNKGQAPEQLALTYVEVRQISSNTATILINSNKPTAATIYYGTSKSNLDKSAKSSNNALEHLIKLSDLEPNTKYYFTITTTAGSERIDSELFTFRTAIESLPVEIIPSSLIVVSENIILHDSANLISSAIPDITIPTNVLYTAKFKTQSHELVKKITAISRNENVLGINNIADFKVSADSNSVIEISPGNFVTTMSSKNGIGDYNLIFRIEDFNGNISEQPVALFETVKPMLVIDSGSKNPIENARVRFYIYNNRLKVYEELSPNIIPIENPDYSEPDGHVPVVLPKGRYKAEVEGIFHEKKTVEFTINLKDGDGYPKVELTPAPFNLLRVINYYLTTLDDLRHTFNNQLGTIKTSYRLLDFAGFLALALFTFLLLMSASHHYSVPIFMLPWFALYHIVSVLNKKKHEYVIQGVILDRNTQVGVENATVYISTSNGKINAHTRTNSFGEFYATSPTPSVRLTISHRNYRSFTQSYKANKTGKRLNVSIIKIKKDHILTLDGVFWYSRYIFSSLFESLIFITFLLEIALIATFGIVRVLPFIVISAISLILWASLHKNRKITK